VHVVIPSGVFTGSAMIEVANLSESYGNHEIRFDMEQSLYILGVKDVDALLNESFFEKYKSVNTPYFNHLIACAGTAHCPFGVIENKNDAMRMSTYLSEKVVLESGRVRMYWSACVKGCGIHGLGDVGFEGCKAKVDGETQSGVHISLGGKLTSEGVEGYTVVKSAPLRYAHFYVETLMLEYKKHKGVSESFEQFHDRVLSQYTSANIGFIMQLGAYLREKKIDIEFGFATHTTTGKNEEFEVFEVGRKLYAKLAGKEAYSAYERFTNVLKNEKLESVKDIVPHADENLAKICEKILDTKEEKRAVVFSELIPFITL
jgi:ferredoxin-nitrite reductase